MSPVLEFFLLKELCQDCVPWELRVSLHEKHRKDIRVPVTSKGLPQGLRKALPGIFLSWELALVSPNIMESTQEI